MKNKLIISTETLIDGSLRYKLSDNNTLYLITRDLTLAEKTAEVLKLEYKREKQNASKV